MSIVDYLKAKGMDSSIQARKAMYETLIGPGYKTTDNAAQNTELLRFLQEVDAMVANAEMPEFDTSDTGLSGKEVVHAALDVLGMLPFIGTIADTANAGWYVLEGNWADAGLSMASAIPFFGLGAKATKAGKTMKVAAAGVKAGKVGHIACFWAKLTKNATEVWKHHGKFGKFYKQGKGSKALYWTKEVGGKGHGGSFMKAYQKKGNNFVHVMCAVPDGNTFKKLNKHKGDVGKIIPLKQFKRLK